MEFFKENINLGEVAVQLIAFVIVFWTLKILAWKPLLRSLELRREKIRTDFERNETARREIEALKSEYHAHLQKIEDEARAKIQQAVEEGRKISKEIQERARGESQAAFEKAKENIELEMAKARLTLRRDIADLALGVTERVLKEKLSGTKEQHEKLFEIIEELEKSL